MSSIATSKDTFFLRNNGLNCNGQLLNLTSPLVMGILNVTPDSFSDGGQFFDKTKAISHGLQIYWMPGMRWDWLNPMLFPIMVGWQSLIRIAAKPGLKKK